MHLAVKAIGERLAESAPDGSQIPGQFTYLIRPKSLLVIGRLHQLTGQAGGDHLGQVRSFELYRRLLAEPEVITFAELLARAEAYVDTAATTARHRPAPWSTSGALGTDARQRHRSAIPAQTTDAESYVMSTVRCRIG